jgi:hypothetical protein
VGSLPRNYCVIDTLCTDRLNVRDGPFGTATRLGSLSHSAVGVGGTGWMSVDEDGRPWVQIEWQGGVGWAAGWFLSPAPCTPSPGTPCVCAVDGPVYAFVHDVDPVGRFIEFDPISWVWIGPADTEYVWENPDLTLVRLPVADATIVESCDPADGPLCLPPDFTVFTIDDLATWVENGTEVGQNRRFQGEVPGHNGQMWFLWVTECSVTEIIGLWAP